MWAEWTIFTQVSGVQRCPRSSRQMAADDLRPVHAIVVAGRAARPLSTPDEFFDDDELMVHEIDSTPPRSGPVDSRRQTIDELTLRARPKAEGRERIF